MRLLGSAGLATAAGNVTIVVCSVRRGGVNVSGCGHLAGQASPAVTRLHGKLLLGVIPRVDVGAAASARLTLDGVAGGTCSLSGNTNRYFCNKLSGGKTLSAAATTVRPLVAIEYQFEQVPGVEGSI